jgi:hypothetical protein
MSNLDIALENLKACKTAADQYVVMSNKIYEENTIGRAETDAKIAAYNQRLREHNEKLRRWELYEGEYAGFKGWDNPNVPFYTKCVARPSCEKPDTTTTQAEKNLKCRTMARSFGYAVPDTYYASEMPTCNSDAYFCFIGWNGEQLKCEKSVAITSTIRNNYYQAKPVFTEGDPPTPWVDRVPDPSNILCCANIMNVTGDASENVQKCYQYIDQSINNIANQPSPTTTPSPTNNPPLPTTDDEDKKKKIIFGSIAAGVCLLLLILISILIYLAVKSKRS